MKSKLSSQKFKLSYPFDTHNAAITHSTKRLEFDPSKLRPQKSLSLKRQSKITTASRDLFELLIRTSLKISSYEIDEILDLTKESDTTAMLLTEHQYSSWKTEPQVAATVKIIADVSCQAAHFRTTFCFASVKTPTFKQVLLAMDDVAAAVGPIADCHRFAMDVEMAAAGILECFGSSSTGLFSLEGKCNRAVLRVHAKRLTAIRSTNPFNVLKFVPTSNARVITRLVLRAYLFEFSLGKIDTKDSSFMECLAKYLEGPR